MVKQKGVKSINFNSPKITKGYLCLWFEDQALEAADFYCSVFPNSRMLHQTPFSVHFECMGMKIMALNGRMENGFTHAVSLVIPCSNQDEIDYYWSKLTENGGAEGWCGWCTDRFGVSWQLVPEALGTLMSDPTRGPRITQAFKTMRKFDLEALLQA